MRYIVGYTATEEGRDALNLAVALARRQDAGLDVVVVVPDDSPFQAVYPPEHSFGSILSGRVKQWLEQARALIPADVPVRTHARAAESDAEGLIAAAGEFDAALIVIGAGKPGPLGRFSIGSVASTLLHAAHVPVALAPRGYHHTAPVTRLTALVGTRAGAGDVLDVAITAAGRRSLPLRLVSLVALDIPAAQREQAVRAAEEHGGTRLAEAAAGLSAGGRASVEVAHGGSIEAAIEALVWDEGEVVLVGSSRLARASRLFLGSTANKILHTLPVPMVVVPRGYRRGDALNSNSQKVNR